MKARIVEVISEYVDQKGEDETDQEYMRRKSTAMAKAEMDFETQLSDMLNAYRDRNPQITYARFQNGAGQHFFSAVVAFETDAKPVCGRCEMNRPINGDYLCEDCR